MNSDKKEKNINISLIDYIGKIDNGVAVILSLSIDDNLYEMIYWFDNENNRSIKIEEKFYHHYPEIRDIYEYEYLIDLLYYVDMKLLPPKEEIFAEFFNI